MALPSYHVHTTFCDGKNTAEEMVLAAIKAGMTEIGFSAHSRMPYHTDWCMTEAGEREYFETVTALKEKYKDKIRIYLGIEQDYYSVPVSYPYDYIIGSVHSLKTPEGSIDVDLDEGEVRRNVEKYYNSDPYLYVENYFATVAKVYEVTGCDVIGHFDLVTKFIEKDPLFSTGHPRYVAARDKALTALLSTPAVFEINTGAVSRGYRSEPYPEMSVIEKIAEIGKPFVINSDSHSANSINFMVEDIAIVLDDKKIPYITTMSELLEITRG